MRYGIIAALFVLTIGTTLAAEPMQRTLTFEDRVIAQERIDAVYASALAKPASAPLAARASAESKVRETLKKSILLANYWKTPVTQEALRHELDRIERGTGMPERLRELYSVLGDDSLVIEEGLARPVLVDRLTKNFFAYDNRIHASTRAETEALRTQIEAGARLTNLGHASCKELELGPGNDAIARAQFDAAVRSLPEKLGVPGRIQEEETAFTFDVAVERRSDLLRLERYSVPKQSWGTWWAKASIPIDDAAVLGMAEAPIYADASARALTVSGPDCNPGGTWNNGLLGDLPDPRFGHTALWTGAEMIVWGGSNQLNRLNTGARYDPLIDTWRKISIAGAPSARSVPALWTGSEMIIWGGNALDNGGMYDPTSDTWRPITTNGAPTSVFGETAVWTGTEMFLWNGTSGHRYRPSTDTWRPMSTLGEPTGGQAVWTGAEMIVWGVNGGARYDPLGDTWTPMSTTGVPPQAGLPLVWTGTEVIAWAGFGSGVGGLYNPASDSWRPMAPCGCSSGDPAQLVWAGTELIVISSPEGPIVGYDPQTDTWTGFGDSYPIRGGATFVWTGTQLIGWGGRDAGGSARNQGTRVDLTTGIRTPTGTNGGPGNWETSVLATPTGMLTWDGSHPTEIYDFVLDAWRKIDAPVFFPAIWTGKEVIWGKSTSGGRLDVLDDSWRSLPPGAPATSSVLVWTGHEAIFWDTTGGAMLDPVSNTWVPIPGYPTWIPLPGYLVESTTVWASGKLIFYFPGGGASFDVASSTWRPISTAGSPSASGSMIVSTGNEMVVWGGKLPTYALTNTGAVYNPTTDTWRATTLVNAPAGLVRSAGTWTGHEMLVWGGHSEANEGGTNIGGRYDPVSDRWSGVSADGAPLARERHMVLWTGRFAVIWGGVVAPELNSGNILNVGGRLFLDAIYDDDGDGYSECDGDCDDTNVSVHPGAPEICDGLDDNCDGQIDEDGSGVDSDGDGVHNACDNCRLVANSTQTDTDADRVGDACDNCPLDFNPTQSDFDHDGEGDVCDLNDGLIYIYSTDPNYREWQSEASFTTWNSYRGSLSVLRATGKFTQAPGSNPLAARACGVSDPYVFDADIPAPGDVAFNLVTGMAGGVESSLGTNSAGAQRANANPCP